jgi:starvation-inducible outer membrane lipoprotein
VFFADPDPFGEQVVTLFGKINAHQYVSSAA